MLRRVGLPVLAYAATTVGVGTTLRHLPTLLRFARKRPLPDDLSTADKRMGARVAVETTDGYRYVSTVEHPRGFAGHPLDDIAAVAEEKYRDAFVARGLVEERATELAQERTAPPADDPVSLPALEGS
jgi:hypothetical protein